MRYAEIAPHPALARWVSCYWVLRAAGGSRPEAAAASGGAALERVYPDGCPELIFHRVAPFDVRSGDGFARQPDALVFGQLERRIVLRRPARVETIGVRFHHHGMAALLRLDACELTGRWQPLGDVAGRWAGELGGRVREAADASAALRLIDRTLRRRAAFAAPTDAPVQRALDTLRRTSGRCRVGDVARGAGVSVRQLERGFRRQVGLPPKRLAGILRLRAAFSALAEGGAPPLIDVAQRCGYFDQSHFIRDFRRVTGMPPSRFLQDDGAMARIFVGG